jgi:o-succinylbenzoate synthase
MKASYQQYFLNFKQPSGTSRETWFLFIENDNKIGVGECGLLRGLSIDDRPDYEEKLQCVCDNIHLGKDNLLDELIEFPSIQFGIEMAFLSLESDYKFELFPSDFTKNNQPIQINGLVWMGDEQFMKSQIEQKLADGFKCIKLKIGAIDFQKELDLLALIRHHFDEETIELRVDANGAFLPDEALQKLELLSKFKLHSIEQPIKAGQAVQMNRLCEATPFPVALDEELIGVFDYDDKVTLLETIKPQYIILKPSFIGGIKGSLEWIEIAEKLNIGWWITSALESNIGLNAIAQFTYTLNNKMPQGLGTGGLYTNNFDCPLEIKKGQLFYNNDLSWDFNLDAF